MELLCDMEKMPLPSTIQYQKKSLVLGITLKVLISEVP